ncbi:hypothetical protein CBOM_03341 [Ceraceosorus bombacis]|uniref:Uncharacterized protein n=1 Tax=Ceraceosorus bombacis TaxID=401625 RepID=A0A0P1BKW8_9BASI|nr:hypothetical protein CBOM_03341 [Ceraceosorus bombacis]
MRAVNTRRAERAARRRRRQLRKERQRDAKKLGAASRAARRKARAAKEKAGGVTHYSLYTPVPLTEGALADMEGEGIAASKIFNTLRRDGITQRLHALRRWRRQADGREGDLGRPELTRHHRHSHRTDQRSAMRPEGASRPRHRRRAAFAPTETQEESDAAQYVDTAEHTEEGDLALQLTLPEQGGSSSSAQSAAQPAAMSVSQSGDNAQKSSSGSMHSDRSRGPKSPHVRLQSNQSNPHRARRRHATDERHTGWHMSDVPLTPHTALTSEFARGFEADDPGEWEPLPEAALPLPESPPAAIDVQERVSGEESSTTQIGEGSAGKQPSPKGASPSSHTLKRHAAWWLDIDCPTYLDMTELSKMFPLHPLTVEDILQEEQREKIETFETLGYYFVVLRTVDERYFRYTTGSEASLSNRTLDGDKAQSSSNESTPLNAFATNVVKGGKRTDASPSESIEMQELKGDPAKDASPAVDQANQEELPEGLVGQSSRPLDESAGCSPEASRPRVDIIEGLDGRQGLEGVSVGGTALYLVVFTHGVISFHFGNVRKHVGRVQRRLLDVDQPAELTSDWIAHGLYDSSVDTFFPLLAFVEQEVEEVEMVTSEPFPINRRERRIARRIEAKRRASLVAQGVTDVAPPTSNHTLDQFDSSALPRAYESHVRRQRYVLRAFPRLVLPDRVARNLPAALTEKRMRVSRLRSAALPYGTIDESNLASREEATPRSVVQRIFRLNKPKGDRITKFLSETAQQQSEMLRRITLDRKIVTGLSRILTPKNDVVRGLRKRLVELRGTSTTAAAEMSIYMGDVHDHIITQLAHLASAEARLAEIHTAYLNAIRINNTQVSHSTDEILVILVSITVTIISMQVILALFGTNVTVPTNTHPDKLQPGEQLKYEVLGGVLGGILLVPPTIILYVRYLKRTARRRTAERRKMR